MCSVYIWGYPDSLSRELKNEVLNSWWSFVYQLAFEAINLNKKVRISKNENCAINYSQKDEDSQWGLKRKQGREVPPKLSEKNSKQTTNKVTHSD